MQPSGKAAYWKANLRLLTICLVIWFVVSYVCGIMLVNVLNQIHIGGYPLGFWFAHMNKLDREHDVHED